MLYATGYDHLDVELLRSRGVGLSVLPGYATSAVAEHALAMLLSLATRLHLANDRSRGLCRPDVSLRGVELAGRHLGVVGLGRIGRRVATLGAALGMRVAGTDVDPLATLRARATGVRMGEREWLLRGSDVVVVCASHVHGSPPIIRRHELELLPPVVGLDRPRTDAHDVVSERRARARGREQHRRGLPTPPDHGPGGADLVAARGRIRGSRRGRAVALHERVRDGVLAPRDIAVPFLPWVAPGDFLLLVVALAGLAVLPFVWRAMGTDRGATWALAIGVMLAVVAVGMDSIDPGTWTVRGERLQQSAEEAIEHAALSLLAAVVFRLLGLVDRHLNVPERASSPTQAPERPA